LDLEQEGHVGWSWVDESRVKGRHKWGYVTRVPGSALVRLSRDISFGDESEHITLFYHSTKFLTDVVQVLLRHPRLLDKKVVLGIRQLKDGALDVVIHC
jgi:hypothetical protein